MFISRKHLPRRTFLRGMGVTLALPLLDSMVPAQTPLSKTAASPKSRFCGIYVPHGAIMQRKTAAPAPGESGGDHSRSAAAFLSGARAKHTSGVDVYLGETIDQIIAQKI